MNESISDGEEKSRAAWHEAMRVFDEWGDADASRQAELFAGLAARNAAAQKSP